MQCAKALRDEPVEVTVVDRLNYHLFTPLLYQVASCLLNPSEVAAPLRKVFRGARNVRYRQGEVTDIDFTHQEVRLAEPTVIDKLNGQIAAGALKNRAGQLVQEKIEGGLIRADGTVLYPIRRNIPVMLVDEGIPLAG